MPSAKIATPMLQGFHYGDDCHWLRGYHGPMPYEVEG